MVSKGASISQQVYDYRKRHPKATLKEVQDVFNQYKKSAVKTAYYRWPGRGQTKQNSKRSDTVSTDHETDGTSGKQRKSPVSLTKIDKHLLEEYLLCLIDFDHPDVRIAREIANFVNPKSGMIQEEKVKVEFLGVDKDEQIALAETYRNDIEKEVAE